MAVTQLTPTVRAPRMVEPSTAKALAERPTPVKLERWSAADIAAQAQYRFRDLMWVARSGAAVATIAPRLHADKTPLASLVATHGFDNVARLAMRGCAPSALLEKLDALADVAPPEARARIAAARARTERLAAIEVSNDGLRGKLISAPFGSTVTDVTHYWAGDTILGGVLGTNKTFLTVDGVLVDVNRHGDITVLTSPFEEVSTFTHIAGRPIVTNGTDAFLIDRETHAYIPVPLYGATKELDKGVRFSATSLRSLMFASQKGDTTVVHVNNFVRQYGRAFEIPGAQVTGFDAGPLNTVYVGRADGSLDVLDLLGENVTRHTLGAPVQGVVTAGNTVVVALRDSEHRSRIQFLDAATLTPVSKELVTPTVKSLDIAEKRLVIANDRGTHVYAMPEGVDGHERTQRSRAIFGRAMVRFGAKLTQSPDYREFFVYHTQQHTDDVNKLWHIGMDVAFWSLATAGTVKSLPFVGWALTAGAGALAATAGVDIAIAAPGAMPEWQTGAALLAATPVASYGLGWIGHLAVEKNQPATFGYPVRSLAAEPMVMWNHFVIGAPQWLRDTAVDGVRALLGKPKLTHQPRGMEHQEDCADAQVSMQIAPQLDVKGE